MSLWIFLCEQDEVDPFFLITNSYQFIFIMFHVPYNICIIQTLPLKKVVWDKKL